MKNKAFSLIESIVIMLVLAVTISAAAYLMHSVIFLTESNQKRTTAIYLAQECVELLRNLLETAWKKHLPWDCAFQNATVDDLFIISPTQSPQNNICNNNFSLIWESIPTPDHPKSQLFLKNTFTSHEKDPLATPLPFHRYVRIINEQKNQKQQREVLELQCIVTWKDQGKNQKVTINTLLTNWNQ